MDPHDDDDLRAAGPFALVVAIGLACALAEAYERTHAGAWIEANVPEPRFAPFVAMAFFLGLGFGVLRLVVALRRALAG